MGDVKLGRFAIQTLTYFLGPGGDSVEILCEFARPPRTCAPSGPRDNAQKGRMRARTPGPRAHNAPGPARAARASPDVAGVLNCTLLLLLPSSSPSSSSSSPSSSSSSSSFS